MAYRVVWARRAFQDLETIVSYIAQDSPAYASAVLKNIAQPNHNAHDLSSVWPQGQFDHEDIRELLAYSYRIIYRLQQDE